APQPSLSVPITSELLAASLSLTQQGDARLGRKYAAREPSGGGRRSMKLGSLVTLPTTPGWRGSRASKII
ncbi:MAG TPA: hypothetical protein VKR42_05165, partial [Ktedonobacteraceae bacterium]|nr:hypothetical protein [Ktedonobacteraceae bacterium]